LGLTKISKTVIEVKGFDCAGENAAGGKRNQPRTRKKITFTAKEDTGGDGIGKEGGTWGEGRKFALGIGKGKPSRRGHFNLRGGGRRERQKLSLVGRRKGFSRG